MDISTGKYINSVRRTLTKRTVDGLQEYVTGWTIAQLRVPARRIADRIEVLMHETQTQ